MKKIEQFNESELLELLKPYQKQITATLLLNSNLEEVSYKWLEANGPSNTVSFGGNSLNSNKNLKKEFKKEMSKFICGDPEYLEYHNKFITGIKDLKNTVIIPYGTILANKLGVTATFLYPAIITFFSFAIQIGFNIYCKTYSSCE